MFPRLLHWYAGQHLFPQHFQENDRYYAFAMAGLLRFCRPYSWGVLGIASEIRNDALHVDAGDLLTPDGAFVHWTTSVADSNAVVESRALALCAMEERETMTVYAVLTPLRERDNVAGVNDGSQQTPGIGRFLSVTDDIETPDAHVMPHASLKNDNHRLVRLYYNIRLALGKDECDRLGDIALPILRLVCQDGKTVMDAGYVPPLARIAGSSLFLRRLDNFRSRLHAFVRSGDLPKPAHMGREEIIALSLRQIAAATGSDLEVLSGWDDASPWQLYGVLRRGLAAMLAVESGITPVGGAEPPPYDHDDPDSCFVALYAAYERILSRFIPEVLERVTPRYQDGVLRFRMPDAVLGKGAQAYIAIRTTEPIRTLLAEGRFVAGAPDEVDRALRLALPELELTPVNTPCGLPVEAGRSYLLPASGGAAWRAVLESGELALAYFPEPPLQPDDMCTAAQVIVVRTARGD